MEIRNTTLAQCKHACICSHSLTDKISPSEGDDAGSIPAGNTNNFIHVVCLGYSEIGYIKHDNK